MTIYKKGFLIIVGLVDLILISTTIGYIVWGIQMPNTLAGREMQFMGAYILAVTVGIFVAIFTAVFIICLVKWRKKDGKNI